MQLATVNGIERADREALALARHLFDNIASEVFEDPVSVGPCLWCGLDLVSTVEGFGVKTLRSMADSSPHCDLNPRRGGGGSFGPHEPEGIAG